MRPIIMGLETEFAGFSKGKSPEAVAKRVFSGICNQYPHLNSNERGIFLGNGGRVYIDCGNHLESNSPEVQDPRLIVAYDKAAERLCAEVLKDTGDELFLIKNNLDYLKQVTFGSHENFLIQHRRDHLQPALIPFLASRVILTGSGKLSFNPQGCGFELSQRASFIEQISGAGTTDARALFCTKDENLSREYGRLHLICGDSLMSKEIA